MVVFLSLFVIFGPSLRYAQAASVCSNFLSGFESAPESDIGSELKLFANRFRNQGAGVLTTPSLGHGAADARKAKAYLQEVLDHIGHEAIDNLGIHVVVNIYSSNRVNAFATAPEDFPVQRKILGVAEDGKKIFEIGILQGMLSFFKSEDEMAFVLGHELGHIISNHLDKGKGTVQDNLTKWSSSQGNEVEADFAAIELMIGKYNLDASMSVLERLLSGMSKEIESIDYFLGSHHHPSLRLASVLARIQHLRRTEPKAIITSEIPLRVDALRVQRSPRENIVTRETEEFKKEFWTWFDSIMETRTERIIFHPNMFSKTSYSNLKKSRVMADVTNDLFVQALKRIRSLQLNSQEKLIRVFELLTIYRHVLLAAENANVSRKAFLTLDWIQLQELEHTLRDLSFGETNDWDPRNLILEFDQRTNANGGFSDRTLDAFEVIQDLVNQKTIHYIFKKFAKVSKRWHELLHPTLTIDGHLTLAELEKKLNQAVKHSFKPEDLSQFIFVLKSYPLSLNMYAPEGLNGVKRLFTFGSRLSNSCDNQTLCEAIQDWLKSYEEEFKIYLLNELDRLLSLDFASLNVSDQARTAYKIRNLFSRGSIDFGLEEEDISDYGPRFLVWLELATKSSKDLRVLDHLEYIEDITASLTTEALSKSVADQSQKIKDFMSRLEHLQPSEAGVFLKTLTDQELISLLETIDFQAFEQQDLIVSLSYLTNLSISKIQSIGLKQALIDHMLAKGVTSESIAHNLDTDLKSKEVLEIALKKNQDAQFFYRILLASDELALRVGSKLTATQLLKLTSQKARWVEEGLVLDLLLHPHLIGTNWNPNSRFGYSHHTSTLIESLFHLQDQGISFDRWYEIYHKLSVGEKMLPELMPLKIRNHLSQYVAQQMKAMSASQRHRYIITTEILRLLPVDLATSFLTDYFIEITSGKSIEFRSKHYEELRQKLKLPSDFPDIDVLLKQSVTERLQLQPGQLNVFFKKEDKLQVHGLWVRSFSGLVSEIQRRSLEEQIEFVEYVTGRLDHAPTWIIETAEKLRRELGDSVRFEDLVVMARSRLMRANNVERGLFLMPFFSGASSMLDQPGGQDFLINKILSVIAPRKRALARTLAEGILNAEGRNRSVAFALIFGLKSDSGKPLSEGEILRALLSYGYGVPGIKFAQYLAFTTDFKSLLGELQDQALPLSYYEAIKLLELHFQGELPEGIQVLGIKGSGSVNIGVESFNSLNREIEILSVPREGVETATREDFRRLKKVLIEITRDEEGQRQFGFMLGLLDTIQASVELEFNRPQVFKNHQKLSKILDRHVHGWHVKMVNVYEILNEKVIRMQMADGVPARLMDQKDPKTYREAMSAASTVISDHLMRQSDSENNEYFADSDFHDGQVFINKKTKTVWLIDPGQAVQINDQEFGVAQLILRILSGSIGIDSIIGKLNNSILNPNPNKAFYTKSELEPLLKSKDKNDAFIRLIALTANKGSRVPLPVVQWVLGMNRQLALSMRIDSHLKRKLWVIFAKESALQVLSGPSFEKIIDLNAIIKTLWSNSN